MSRESSNGQNSAFTFESRVPIVTANGAPVPAHDALDHDETPLPALIDAKIHTPPTDEPPAAPESSLSHTETANLDSLKNDRDAISTQTDPMVWPYQEPPQPPKEENAAADEDQVTVDHAGVIGFGDRLDHGGELIVRTECRQRRRRGDELLRGRRDKRRVLVQGIHLLPGIIQDRYRQPVGLRQVVDLGEHVIQPFTQQVVVRVISCR